jgi:hypothetical protein
MAAVSNLNSFIVNNADRVLVVLELNMSSE